MFDYGDTLIRKRNAEAVLGEILADLGYPIDSAKVPKGLSAFSQRWKKRYEDLPRGTRWTEKIRIDCDRASLRALGFKDNLDTLAREVARRWSSYERLGLYEDVKPTLRILEKMGLAMGVVSQSPATGEGLGREIRAYGIAGFFRIVLTSEDTKYDKPDPRLFEEASRMIRFEPSELCYVGNSYDNDVVGARSAGITPVLVDREGKQKSRDCLVIANLLDLPSMLKER